MKEKNRENKWRYTGSHNNNVCAILKCEYLKRAPILTLRWHRWCQICFNFTFGNSIETKRLSTTYGEFANTVNASNDLPRIYYFYDDSNFIWIFFYRLLEHKTRICTCTHSNTLDIQHINRAVLEIIVKNAVPLNLLAHFLSVVRSTTFLSLNQCGRKSKWIIV